MLSLLLYRFLFPFRFRFLFLFLFPFLFRIPVSRFSRRPAWCLGRALEERVDRTNWEIRSISLMALLGISLIWLWTDSSISQLYKFNVNDLKLPIYCVKDRGGGTPLYKPYRYVLPHRVGTSIHFAHFGLESGIVFEGTTGAYESIYRFSCKWLSKKEKQANSKWIWIIFCLRCNG